MVCGNKPTVGEQSLNICGARWSREVPTDHFQESLFDSVIRGSRLLEALPKPKSCNEKQFKTCTKEPQAFELFQRQPKVGVKGRLYSCFCLLQVSGLEWFQVHNYTKVPLTASPGLCKSSS